ncbi:MAG: hypothetical protein WEA09_08900 [Gemmatimonadota bacterium]
MKEWRFPRFALFTPRFLRLGPGNGWLVAFGALALAACGPDMDTTIPGPQTVREYYGEAPGLQVEISGNVARISLIQGNDQLRRGGTLWAKAGPYIYLFSPQTRRLLSEHPGLGGVRVTTRTPAGTWIAEALLTADRMTGAGWARALSAGHDARTEGGESPGLMSTLVRYGEDLTEFRYNPAYAR